MDPKGNQLNSRVQPKESKGTPEPPKRSQTDQSYISQLPINRFVIRGSYAVAHTYRQPKNTHCGLIPVLLARTFLLFWAGFQNMDLGTKLTVKNATDAKTPANSASRRTESNGRRPGPRFGQNPGKKS